MDKQSFSTNNYKPQEIETKWQKKWEEAGLYQAVDLDKRPKKYLLIEFPYPSGERLHVGHGRSYCCLDALARCCRMKGFNVLYPIGWDAFGLPAENYAIKTNINPALTTSENIKNAKKQAKSWGLSFDWSREINTTDPDYYKWTQWIFLKMLEHGLAYRDEVSVNWCPTCKTNLADEEVFSDGTHERCGKPTEKRKQKQWLLRITKYADRLLKDLQTVDYLPKIRIQQENWIGRKKGVKIRFWTSQNDNSIEIFTTRPETILGATFVVLSPNHPLAHKISEASLRVKTVINPATNKEIPVFVDEYVLADYGTGAIMGVPSYDERDMAFAKEHHLPIVKAKFTDKNYGKKAVNYHLRDWVFSRQHYWGEPIPVVYCENCGIVPVPEEQLPVKLPYVEKYEPTGTGESPLANVKDWVETKCPACGGKARRETDTMPNWAGSNWYFVGYVIAKQIHAGGSRPAPTDIFSANRDLLKYWLPVDLYNGGMEHTTLHLLYSRFVYKFLFDLGVVPTSEPYQRRHSHGTVLGSDGQKMSKSRGNVINPDEIIKTVGADTFRLYEMFMGPFEQTVSWNEDGMMGCHRFLKRVWILSQTKSKDFKTPQNLEISLQKTIKKVGEDLEALKFNTAIAAMMEFLNLWAKPGMFLSKKDVAVFLQILAPFAPHLTEELWDKLNGRESLRSLTQFFPVQNLTQDSLRSFRSSKIGDLPATRKSNGWSIHSSSWPKYRPAAILDKEAVMIVEVNGKVREKLEVGIKQSFSANEKLEDGRLKWEVRSEMEKMARESGKVKKYLGGRKVKKVIFVPGKLINFVVE